VGCWLILSGKDEPIEIGVIAETEGSLLLGRSQKSGLQFEKSITSMSSSVQSNLSDEGALAAALRSRTDL
jgi:hypothetical protein